MPITRRQFDLGINEALEQTMRRIHAHLATRRQEAFTSGEVADALQLNGANALDALEKLQLVGAVEARRVNSSVYYAYRRDLPDLR